MVRNLVVVLVVALVVVTSSACDTGPSTEIRRGPTDRRIIALTFDAGSDRGYTVAILDTLKAKRVHAAFGMTGTWARANPALVRRMVAEGHIVVNHTDTHRSFTGYSTQTRPLTTAQRNAELSRAESAVAAAGGPSMKPWFRPPYGDLDAGVLRDAGAAGYSKTLLWTVDSLGWKGLSARAITERCAKGAVNGAIFLFHVGSASQDGVALPGMIDRFRRGGWRLWRVDHLLDG